MHTLSPRRGTDSVGSPKEKKAYAASEAATYHGSDPASLHTHRSVFPEAAQENPLNDYILACGSNCSDNFSLMWRIGSESAISGN